MTFIIHKKKYVYTKFALIVYLTRTVSFSFRIFKNRASFYATRDVYYHLDEFWLLNGRGKSL